jgi:methyl-accepting chemotaxis protein
MNPAFLEIMKQALSDADHVGFELNTCAHKILKALHDLSRGYDQVVKILEQRDRQLDNQSETIDELRQTVNRYAARINELQDVTQAMKEVTDATAALALRAEQNR